MRPVRRHWLGGFALALGLHAAAFVALGWPRAEEDGGAAGQEGLTISLEPLGGPAELAGTSEGASEAETDIPLEQAESLPSEAVEAEPVDEPDEVDTADAADEALPETAEPVEATEVETPADIPPTEIEQAEIEQTETAPPDAAEMPDVEAAEPVAPSDTVIAEEDIGVPPPPTAPTELADIRREAAERRETERREAERRAAERREAERREAAEREAEAARRRAAQQAAPAQQASPTPQAPTQTRQGGGQQSAEGAAQSAPARGGGDVASYGAQLRAWLERHKRYPQQARAQRIEGAAVLAFTVDAGGRVLGYSIQRSSGHPILDAEVDAMIRRAQPLPPIPPDLGRNQISVSVPVQFSVR